MFGGEIILPTLRIGADGRACPAFDRVLLPLPTKDQAASFENFHKVSADMAKLLIASCVQPIPADPMARLDDANDQLTAINYAATTVQIAFDDFYAKLDGAQKSRFE